ncbi:ferredoxin--NADP reductase [Sediminibacter sp. Hel_I_10]|uniref:ferredoxin--NADP reductase n=1 Tax=Sediminibacter sp. Hel_I_10 TaxID=1392490 RepID=UPI000478C329|nr:ferredoxin--NADP reductase [Sediminibacter sp. Hel_I_10]
MAQFHQLVIKDIHRETAKAVAISFEVPESLSSQFQFKAGQYITLKCMVNGKEVRRDYSLFASPKSGLLKVAVKEVANGTFSAYANTTLKVGDTLEVAPPNGRFLFDPMDTSVKNIALFAAGSGITPILSIVKCALEETEHQVVLIYGNKSKAETMFLEELVLLHQKYQDRFHLQLVFSQADEVDAIFGRIEKSNVNYVFKNKHKGLDIDAYYLCGPEAMIHHVKEVLVENGAHENTIHFELFQAAQPAQEASASIGEGQTKTTVILDDETFTFEMSQEDSILQAALDEDIDAPYSCQGGICSSCLARITEGEATMRQNNILTDSEVAEGLILTCQAHPTTASITIDYDDI